MINNKLTFIGPPTNMAGVTTKKDQPCTHFMVGQCKYGESCNFKHEGVPAPQKPKGKVLGGKQQQQTTQSIFSTFSQGQSAGANFGNFG